jgi:CheY-like chemotaxis protein
MRLLVVDDIRDFREIVAQVAENINKAAEVVEASSADDAIELLTKRANFDLIVCDYNMPGRTGDAVFDFLTASGLNIPFILFTALPSFDLKRFRGNNFAGAAQKHDLPGLARMMQSSLSHEPLPQ